MAYRAEIEIGVKGANKLRDLQDRIGKVSKEIDLLGARDLFENKTLQNIQTYNQALKDAADNLKVVSFASEKTAKATDTETKAIKTYVSALLSAESAQLRQNRLIDEEIVRRKGATQQLKAYNAEAAAATQRGAATTMSGAYLRGQPVFGPQPAPGFDPIAGASRANASRLSLGSIAAGRATQQEFAQKQKIFDAELQFNRQLNVIKQQLTEKTQKRALSGALDNAMTEFKLRDKNADELFRNMMRDNDKLLKKFDKDLKDIDDKRDQRARQRNKFRENLALGVGFPLLFGGGAGAVTGGALGAVAGRGKDGFGLQILFSAIGQIVDSAFTNLKDSASSVASSLGGTVSTLEALRDVGIRVKDSNIEYIQSLEDSGQAVLAYELVQKQLTDLYGNEGVAALQELKSANEFANTETGKLTAVLQTELAPVFISLAQAAGVAARVLRTVIPAIGDASKGLLRRSIGGPAGQALGIFNFLQQIESRRPKTDQGRVDAGARDAAFQLQGQIQLKLLNNQNDSLTRANELIKAGNDLTDERIVDLKEMDIIEKASARIQLLDDELAAMGPVIDTQRKQAIELERKNILQQENNELTQLGVDVELAKARAAEKAGQLLKSQTKEAERLAKAAKLEQRKISKLENQLKLGEKLLVIDEKIFQARLEDDRTLEASLQKQRLKSELETKIANIKTEGLNPVIQELVILLETLNVKRNIAKVDQNLTRLNVENEKSAAAKLKSLQDEGALLQARLDGRLEEVQLDQQIEKILETNTHLTREQVEAALRGNQALKEQVSALEELESMYAAIGQSISNGIVDALTAAVEGTKSLADAASQVLRQVASILLQFGVNTALGGIPGLSAFFPGRATGGPVTGGKPYMVGEKGPELFVPNSSGNIVPNNKLGGGANVVVNVDAKGTSASGDSAAGKQLGGLIGAAVQSELIKQQRPGGLLAR